MDRERSRKMNTGGKSYVSSPPVFSNDARRLLVCTGNTVSIFSTSTGLQISQLEGHDLLVTSVTVVPASTPGSKVLCYCWTSSLDGTIKYWDFAAPELMRTIDIHLPIHSMVIPCLSSQKIHISEKLPDLFAYVYTKDVKRKEGQHSAPYGHVRKCNLMKSRLVGGVTLAETAKPGSIAISPTGKHIGIFEKHTIRIWDIPVKDSDSIAYKKVRLHHTKSFTTLAFHPTEKVVAAGDVTGRILLWRGVGRRTFSYGAGLINGGSNNDEEVGPGVRDGDDADSCTTWHWHSSQVNVLYFSSDGAYLYSGGREGVLVVWQLDTGKKKFLPRIGSPLLHFTISPDPSLASMSCADNHIQLLRMPSMECIRSISGVKLPIPSSENDEGVGTSVSFNRSAGMIAIPAPNYRIQFYSLFNDREISEVQICERNHQPSEEITLKVNLVALSSDASTMATVETRLPEEGIGGLVCLKFWSCCFTNKDFTLSTVIYEPHREAQISSIVFRPTGHMAVSASYGGDFRVWVNKYDRLPANQQHKGSDWTCFAVGSYKKQPMTAAAFSGDGSVLAVAADKVITLWDPDRNILEAVIGVSLEQITALSFVGNSEYLVTASHGSNPQLILWSMSKLSICWSYMLHVEDITCSIYESSFAVLADSKLSKCMESDDVKLRVADGSILFFNVQNPVPLSTWAVNKAEGGRLSFIMSCPELEENTETKTAEVLVYVNSDHEYVLFNPYVEKFNKLSISRRHNFGSQEEPETFGYASIYGELPAFSPRIDQPPLPTAPSEKTWKTIFSGPSHSLPPLPKLCSDFLESLLERAAAVE